MEESEHRPRLKIQQGTRKAWFEEAQVYKNNVREDWQSIWEVIQLQQLSRIIFDEIEVVFEATVEDG
ncbi:hypothetical protein Tco_0151386 [Tanacetum coccineum]